MALSLIASVPAQEQQTIKSTSRLVQVNVLVRDGNGNPLTNLTKDDFTLQVSSNPQQSYVA
jgi:ribosomal protein L30E